MPNWPPRRVAIIANPATRRDASKLVAAVAASAPAGVELDVRVTAGAGEATALARAASRQAELVIAVGGDGTVADVATGVLGSGVPLGIMPAGSTNITARELGIPSEPGAAASLLFGSHRLATIDVGRCGDRCFLHMGGAGLDSRFFEQTNRALKRRVGWLAYVPPAALALRLRPARFTISADGQAVTVTSQLVLVANGASIISPILRLHPEIRSDVGWLDVLVFTATDPLAIARTLGRFATVSLDRSPFVVRLRARRIELAADPPLAIELDGDVVSRTPATFYVLEKALNVVAPVR